MSNTKKTKKVEGKTIKVRVAKKGEWTKTPYELHNDTLKAYEKAREASHKAEQRFYSAKGAKETLAALKEYKKRKEETLAAYEACFKSLADLERMEVGKLGDIIASLEAAKTAGLASCG